MIEPSRLRPTTVLLALGFVAVAVVLGLTLGPAGLPPGRVLLELLDHVPFVDVDSGLSDRQADIVWELRLPRVVMGLLVGSMLAGAGAAYQGAFRNALADPYLLGVAAGAGFGATLGIVTRSAGDSSQIVPLWAFVGAVAAVVLTYALGASRREDHTSAPLVLAGVAVTAVFTALQTYVQQRHAETIREVYSWILGRLVTTGWRDVAILAPYVLVTSVVLLRYRRVLDVLSVGDEEAATLGVAVRRARFAVVVTASLGTAAAVAMSGLIGFVGIIIPHTLRLMVGSSYRRIVPLSLLVGGGFLALTDLVARTLVAPSELPIGVVTAFLGAPFFLALLRTQRTAVA
jgi:iron complex transport system permease protein